MTNFVFYSLCCVEVRKTIEQMGHKMYWDYDGHPTPEAYLMAGKLAAQIK